MYDFYELWMSRSAVLLWLPRSAWTNPSMHTIPNTKVSPRDAASREEPFLDPTCVAYPKRGVDWFWKVNALVAARLFRASRVAGAGLQAAFPWTAGGIPVVRCWLAQDGPEKVQEADRLSLSGPVALPPFDPCCVALAQFGEIPRWIDWEKDQQKLREADVPPSEPSESSVPLRSPTDNRKIPQRTESPALSGKLF